MKDSPKVMTNIDQLRELLNHARRHDLVNEWCDTALAWGESANDAANTLIAERDAALARVAELEPALEAVKDLISNSEGVTGLHLNGDIATWDDLRTGGRFEQWLSSFDTALNGET